MRIPSKARESFLLPRWHADYLGLSFKGCILHSSAEHRFPSHNINVKRPSSHKDLQQCSESESQNRSRCEWIKSP